MNKQELINYWQRTKSKKIIFCSQRGCSNLFFQCKIFHYNENFYVAPLCLKCIAKSKKTKLLIWKGDLVRITNNNENEY